MTHAPAPAASTRDPICDFCGSDDLGPSPVTFGCDEVQRVVPDVGLIVFEAGSWGACSDCVPLVRARAWRQIIDRQIAVRRSSGDPAADSPLLRPELAALLLAVGQKLTGAEQPWAVPQGAAA